MRILLLMILTSVLTIPWGTAQAKFAMAFDDPATDGIDIIVEDGGLGDINPDIGHIRYCHFGGDLRVCATGLSKFTSGSTTHPGMVLRVDDGTYSGGDLKIMLSDTDFSTVAGTAELYVWGDVEGGESLTVDFLGDPDNQPFEPGFNIATYGPYLSPVYNSGDSSDVSIGPVGSLTISALLKNGSDPVNDIKASFEAQLFVSPESDYVQVPGVVGMEQSAAEQAIESVGLEVGMVTTQSSESVAAGDVISQDPRVGNWLPPGSPVDLVVSRGLAPPPVANPAGLSGSWYDPLLSGEGYEVGVTPVGLFIYYYGHDQSGRRLWLSSSFHEGAIVYGQSITLTLSQGSGTFTDPSDDLEEWGSIIMIFDTCTSGRAQMTGKDGEKRVDILKIIGIGDLDCDL